MKFLKEEVEKTISQIDTHQGPEEEVDINPESFQNSWLFKQLELILSAQPNFPESIHPIFDSPEKEKEKFLQANVFIDLESEKTRAQTILIKTEKRGIFYFYRNTEKGLANSVWKHWHIKNSVSL